MKNYFKITTLSFFERISFAIGRTSFTIGIIYFYGYEINGQFSAFWSLVVIVSTFFLFGLDTILITYAKNENENFGYLGKKDLNRITYSALIIGALISGLISFFIFSTYENILDINIIYFFFASVGFLSINIHGNLLKGYGKFNYLIYINLISFFLSILYLLINKDGDGYSVFNTWIVFSSIILILNFVFYFKTRKNIPDTSYEIEDIFSQAIQKYIYRMAYQLAIRADILIVYNLVNKELAGVYATARLIGDLVGYLHQGFYPILISKKQSNFSNEFKYPKLFLFLIGLVGFILINITEPFLLNYFSFDLIKLTSFTIFGSSVFNLIIFQSAEVIGKNNAKYSILFLSINILSIFIIYYVFNLDIGVKFLVSQFLSYFIILFIDIGRKNIKL